MGSSEVENLTNAKNYTKLFRPCFWTIQKLCFQKNYVQSRFVPASGPGLFKNCVFKKTMYCNTPPPYISALPWNSNTSQADDANLNVFLFRYTLSLIQESITMRDLSNTYRRNPSKVHDLVLSVWLNDEIHQGQLNLSLRF